jgi:hypothetical protein
VGDVTVKLHITLIASAYIPSTARERERESKNLYDNHKYEIHRMIYVLSSIYLSVAYPHSIPEG